MNILLFTVFYYCCILLLLIYIKICGIWTHEKLSLLKSEFKSLLFWERLYNYVDLFTLTISSAKNLS